MKRAFPRAVLLAAVTVASLVSLSRGPLLVPLEQHVPSWVGAIIAPGDGDGDADDDPVTTAGVLVSDGDAAFTALPGKSWLSAASDWTMALGDIDGDGDLDALAWRPGNLDDLLNDGSGRSRSSRTAAPPLPSFGNGVAVYSPFWVE
jgi:hypothetical protein